MRYDVVLLDLDNTLFDFGESETGAYHEAMTAAGCADPAALFDDYARINGELWDQVEAGTVQPSEVRHLRFSQLAATTAVEFDIAVAAESFVTGLGRHGGLLPGAEALLTALAELRAPLIMVTNGLSDVQWAKINRLDLERWFAHIVISDEIGFAKPDPQIFDVALAPFADVDRQRVVMIGDSLSSDIAGGVAANVDTCWFDRHRMGPSPHAATPTMTVTALDEIPNMFR